MKRLSEVEAYEFELPFYRMRIDKYEGCIKRFVSRDDNCTVTMDQLRYAFAEDEPWKAIDDDSSMLYRLFDDPELKDEDSPDKLNVHKLIILGLLLCGGSAELKARVFYDVL